MSLVKSSQLLEIRVKKAVTLINQLRADKEELEERLKMVLNHNEELQVLLDKSSADSKEIEAALESANLALDSLEGLDDIAFDVAELEDAEQFTLDGATAIDGLDSFETIDLDEN